MTPATCKGDSARNAARSRAPEEIGFAERRFAFTFGGKLPRTRELRQGEVWPGAIK
jgi:hypothetical protein